MKFFRLTLPFAVFTNTLYQGIGKVVTTIFGLIVTIILTRYLGVLGFGEFNLVIAYLAIAATISDFGLITILTRQESENRVDNDFLNTIFTLRLVLSALILFVFDAISFFLYPQNVVVGIIIYSLGNLFLLAYGTFTAIFQAHLRMEKHVFAQIVGSFISLIATIIFVYYQLSFGWIVFSQVAGILTSFFIGLNLLDRKINLYFNLGLFYKILKQAWPFFIISILTILYWKIDLVLLAFFKNPSILPDVGIYSTAYRIFEVMVIFGGFFTQALFPVFIKEKKGINFDKIYNESLILSLIVGLFSVISVLLLAGLVIYIVAGDGFEGAVVPLKVLSLAFPLTLFINIFYNQILIIDRQKYVVPVGLVALLFNFIANIIFIPQFSYLAASVVTVLTTLIVFAGYFIIILVKGKKTI